MRERSRAAETGCGLTVHACAVRVGNRGILIRGASGAGKSSLLLGLLHADPSAVLVADDRVVLSVESGRLIATVPDPIAGLIEVRGVGLVRRPHVSPVPIDLAVDLLPLAECPRLPEGNVAVAVIAEVSIPRICIAIGAPDGALRVLAAADRAFLVTV
jgi:HPr kinase/phosphorylase